MKLDERWRRAFDDLEAVLFDMDGTLVDSEDRTERAVAKLLATHGIDASGLALSAYHGVTWESCASDLVSRWPRLGEAGAVARALSRMFHATFVSSPPPQIRGAAEAVLAAAVWLPVAIVTSSDRVTLQTVVAQLAIEDALKATVAAEDISRSKPDPEPYALAARRLGVAPERCLVFEDSDAGVSSALAAGARVIAVGAGAAEREHLSFVGRISNYCRLPIGCFQPTPNGREG